MFVVKPSEIRVFHKHRRQRGKERGHWNRERERERQKDITEEAGKQQEEKKSKKHMTSVLKPICKVSEGTVRYCFLAMSSQADLNCDVKPGNSV